MTPTIRRQGPHFTCQWFLRHTDDYRRQNASAIPEPCRWYEIRHKDWAEVTLRFPLLVLNTGIF
jgi:hypothetical protein